MNKSSSTPPRTNTVTIVDRIKQCYLIWIHIIPHIIKLHRATIGNRIGSLFLEILESSYHAYYATKDEKIPLIIHTMKKLESLKLLITVSWEGKLIQNAQFTELTKELNEIGKMLGGWKRGIESKTNPER